MDLKDTVNTIKKVDNVLRNVVPITESIVNRVRGNIGSWGFVEMLTTPIENYCLTEMGDWQLRKHMLLNLIERQTTIDMIGDSVSGISNKVSDEVYKNYHSYNDGNNYIEDYQREAKFTTTRNHTYSDRISYNNNYGSNVNIYPDENNTGYGKNFFQQRWDDFEGNRNRNSIINKTKELFNTQKINTIISSFHTDPDRIDLYDGTDAKTEYGLSHGRNLLTYDAEYKHRSYDRNGYDNPYCRVWTHHHQYSDLRARLMRPFTVEDENGNVTYGNNQKLHKWDSFPNMKDGSTKREFRMDLIDFDSLATRLATNINSPFIKRKPGFVNVDQKWGWKDSGADGWEKSVLDKETGLVNITPKYLGGAETNIHTKDCMFSIENLAWQGYDPYSFERALSWEQRGPFGGRIMWFPPYGLRFNEDTSVNWSEHSFIGRGENVFTYTNTSRSGTLEFMMLVDHPSILDYSTWYGNGMENDGNLPKDTDIYRFFAGCNGNDGEGSLTSFVKPTPLTDEYLQEELPTETIKVNEKQKPESPNKPIEPSTDEEAKISFYVFFPNNYSGYYDMKDDSNVDPIAYLLFGNGAQWKCDTDDVTRSKSLSIDFDNNQNWGRGYEMHQSKSDKGTQDEQNNFIIGTSPNWKRQNNNEYKPDNNKKWYYRIDGEYEIPKENERHMNTFDQTLKTDGSYLDKNSFGLNYDIDEVNNVFSKNNDNEEIYTLAEIVFALKNDKTVAVDKIIENTNQELSEENKRVKKLIEYFRKDNNIWKITKIDGIGYSNSHGSNPDSKLNNERNEFLAKQRCQTVYKWFTKNYSNDIEEGNIEYKPGKNEGGVNQENESGKNAKKWRSAKMTLTIVKSKVNETTVLEQESNLKYISVEQYVQLSEDKKVMCEPSQYEYKGSVTKGFKLTMTAEEYNWECSNPENTDFPCKDYVISQYSMPKSENDQEEIYKRFDNFKEVEKDINNTQLYVNVNETKPSRKERRWYYDESTKEMKLYKKEYKKTLRNAYNWNSDYDYNQVKVDGDYNSLRYDQEYHFFKKLEATHPDVFKTLVQKVQYFDPAFHSMTPEGFMGRLNFLQQCTRQGNTISASDKNGHSANNLAFGRPPFCILRIGDFYYQKIVIRNINITYDPLVLDLNNEGIGVVPLIANVTISFNFIGGGDLSGPVRKLQNAMSFNFYANGRLYDNRADRVERENTQWDTMGAMGHDKVDFNKSYFHDVKMAK